MPLSLPLSAPCRRPPLAGRARVAALLAGAALALTSATAWAQAAAGGSIYSCTDAQGRRITSDRPILTCIDREQRELNRGGGTRRVIPPTLTATEREAREAQEREAALGRQRARDAIRRDQALVSRYPDKAAHEVGRKEALAQTQLVIDAAERRLAELAAERKSLDEEMEFYRKDPAKAPFKVRRGLEDNTDAAEAQRRAIAAQMAERVRINASFDDEAKRLQALWQGRPVEAAAPASAPLRP